MFLTLSTLIYTTLLMLAAVIHAKKASVTACMNANIFHAQNTAVWGPELACKGQCRCMQGWLLHLCMHMQVLERQSIGWEQAVKQWDAASACGLKWS